MRNLSGKRAVVTGAASGIGREIALELARHGTHVCLWDIDSTGLAETESLCRGPQPAPLPSLMPYGQMQ
jgi:NAD(P)-dependent dehydrogenase (short-subunit alcohol dehydrogenase family)